MAEIITIIISVAAGVVVGNMTQVAINEWKISYLVRRVVHRVAMERFKEDPADCRCGGCHGGEDDE